MKFMIASDLHGSLSFAEKLFCRFEEEKPEKLLLLGDLLSHGARNDLPEGYNTKGLTALLNAHKDDILAVRGNCEAEVDQMVLEFPVMAEYALLVSGKNLVYLTHGHIHGEENPPALQNGDILLTGHTHIPKRVRHDSWVYMNPGSVGIPKGGCVPGYMICEDGKFTWKDLDHMSPYMEYEQAF